MFGKFETFNKVNNFLEKHGLILLNQCYMSKSYFINKENVTKFHLVNYENPLVCDFLWEDKNKCY